MNGIHELNVIFTFYMGEKIMSVRLKQAKKEKKIKCSPFPKSEQTIERKDRKSVV